MGIKLQEFHFWQIHRRPQKNVTYFFSIFSPNIDRFLKITSKPQSVDNLQENDYY